MTIQQTIAQLEDLIEDRQCFVDPNEHGVFDEDIRALGQAIMFLQEMKIPVQYQTESLRITLHYGIQHQLLKMIEEMGELQAAIIRQCMQLEQQAEADKPKVLFADSVATAKTSILIGELAMCGMMAKWQLEVEE